MSGQDGERFGDQVRFVSHELPCPNPLQHDNRHAITKSASVLFEADGDDRFDLAGMLVRNIYFESETRIN